MTATFPTSTFYYSNAKFLTIDAAANANYKLATNSNTLSGKGNSVFNVYDSLAPEGKTLEIEGGNVTLTSGLFNNAFICVNGLTQDGDRIILQYIEDRAPQLRVDSSTNDYSYSTIYDYADGVWLDSNLAPSLAAPVVAAPAAEGAPLPASFPPFRRRSTAFYLTGQLADGSELTRRR